MTAIPPNDLIVLVADKNTQFAVRGLLSRHAALGIRQITSDIYVHPERDPGCLRKCDAFLSSFRQSHRHAMVVFDREGCGREEESRSALEQLVEKSLLRTGWEQSRVAAVSPDPELEVWVWSDSPEVDACLGWHGNSPGLRPWLRANRFLTSDFTKPTRPKEAMEAALRQVRKARSSAIFRALAESVSVERCADPAFAKFRATLTKWFPIT
jgi:hypothetical protein